MSLSTVLSIMASCRLAPKAAYVGRVNPDSAQLDGLEVECFGFEHCSVMSPCS
jgi:hypothetical protein